MSTRISAHDLAYSALFGAAALLLPTLFHVLRLGPLFLPMYLPLVALAFFVRPASVAITAAAVPLLSGATTGMPPLYPPIALCMSVELAAMGAAIAALKRRFPRAHELALLVPTLLLGRALSAGLAYGCAALLGLPQRLALAASLLTGWPGIVLMVVVVPIIARAGRRLGAGPPAAEEQP